MTRFGMDLNDRHVPLEQRIEHAKQLFVTQPQEIIDWIFPLLQKLTPSHEIFKTACMWDLLGMIFNFEPLLLCFPNARLPLRLPLNLVLLPFQRCPDRCAEYLPLLKPHAANLQPNHLMSLLKEAKEKECCVDLLVSMAKAMVPRRSFQLALEVLPLLSDEQQVAQLFPLLFSAEHVAELVNLIADEKKRAYQGDLLTLMRERHTACLLKGLSPHLDRRVAFELFLQLDSPKLIDAVRAHYTLRNDEVFHWQQAQLKSVLDKHQTEECWMAMLSLDVHLILDQPIVISFGTEFWRLFWQESCKARQLPRLLPILFAHQPKGAFPFALDLTIPTPLSLNTLLPMIPADEFGEAIACQLLWQSDYDDALLDQLETIGGKLLLASLLDRRPTSAVLDRLSKFHLDGDLAVKVAHYRGDASIQTCHSTCSVWPALNLDQRMQWLEQHGLTLEMLKNPRFPDLVDYHRLFKIISKAPPAWIRTILMETPPECLKGVPWKLLCKLPIELRLEVMLRGQVHWDRLDGPELESCPSALVRQCLKQMSRLPESKHPKLSWLCQVEMARRGSSLSLPTDLALIEAEDFALLSQHGLISQLSYEQHSPLWSAWMSYCDQIELVRPHWKSLLKRYVFLIERDLSLDAMVAEVLVHPDPCSLLTALMTHGKERQRLVLSARMAYQLICSNRYSVPMLHRLILLKGVWLILDLLPLLEVMRADEPGASECLLALVNHYPHYYHPRILELVCGMLDDEVNVPKIVQQLASNQQCRWDLLGYPLILHALTKPHIPRALEMSLFTLMSQMHNKDISIWDHIHRMTKGPIEKARWKRLHSDWKRTFVQL